MRNREYAIASRAHEIATSLDIPFGAAWQVAQCLAKASYETREDAQAVAARYGQRVYECPICGRFHASSGRGGGR